MGDPAGIGPEIAVKALISKKTPDDCRIFIIGDYSIVLKAAELISTEKKLNRITELSEYNENFINILDIQLLKNHDVTPGAINSFCGKASYEYVLKAITLAKQGTIDAIVTNPISKAALHEAGIKFPGHTEILAQETHTEHYSMMFMLDKVCVSYVTTHCSLKKAIELISMERVFENICLLDSTLKSLGFENPRIAVSGLNPHAGENGLFGDEELLYINPAVLKAKHEGIDVTGSLPPDTVFMRAFKGEFDGIVSMLHDHGFVALKSRDFEHGVNITVGLPIIRTSVGHGTAFDIAWKGIASERSLLEAIKVAYMMSQRKQGKT